MAASPVPPVPLATSPSPTAPRATRRLGAALLACAAAVPLALLPAAAAHGAPAAGGPVVHQVTAAEQQAARAYWTRERIAALTTPAADKPPLAAADGAPWTGGGAVSRTTGRLFFTDHGEDASCTATVVASANRSTLVTAGHCVHNTDLLGDDPQWNAHEFFVPGYRDGRAPYGGFPVRAAVVDATWLANDQQHPAVYDTYDQAFAVVGRNAQGRSVQDAVGAAQRLGFDVPGDREAYAFGYPRAAADPAREGLPEYTGERLAHCRGSAPAYPGTPDFPEPPDQRGPACVMGGGASGGPRLAAFDPGTGAGTVVGVNTRAGHLDAAGDACATDAPGCVRHLVGPQFSTAVTRPLHEAAQHA